MVDGGHGLENHHTSVTVFPQMEFKVPGAYFVEIAVDDVMKLRYPLPVIVVQPANAPQGGQRPAAPPENPPGGAAPAAS